MTDYEVHREEWILERAGMLMEDQWRAADAMEEAERMWLEYEAARNAQEPAK